MSVLRKHQEMTEPAIVFTDVGRVGIDAVAISDPGPGEVLVRTTSSMISAGTEGWLLQNEFTWDPTPYPCVPGYQRAGRIVAVADDVEGLRVGDRVAATKSVLAGKPAAMWGAHIAAANSSALDVYRLPEGVGDVEAAAAVVAQVGYNAASRVSLETGQFVVVLGDGVIGQLAAQAARSRGARVVLVGHREDRMALAAVHSADHVVDGRADDLLELVRACVSANTVAAVIDTVQSGAAEMWYLNLLEPGSGQVVYSGFTPGTAWADMGLLQQREITAHFVSGWTRPRMEATLGLLANGQLRVGPLVTHHVPAQEAPEMYAMIRRKTEPCLAVALDWRRATE
jgi:3-hydroxyethyl bacteriochlorophyllide a dehydrogenase